MGSLGTTEDEDDEEFITHYDTAPDDEFHSDPANLDPPSDVLPCSPTPQGTKRRKAPVFCPVIQPKLRQLLFELFTQLPGAEASGKFFSPLLRYVVISSIGPGGQWEPSGDITQRISPLLFAGRLTMYSEMDKGLQAGQHHGYHESVSVFLFLGSLLTRMTSQRVPKGGKIFSGEV